MPIEFTTTASNTSTFTYSSGQNYPVFNNYNFVYKDDSYPQYFSQYPLKEVEPDPPPLWEQI